MSCVLIALSFTMFAVEEGHTASEQQRGKLNGYERPAPPPPDERERERRHGGMREAIDDANDLLLRPFVSVADDGGRWRERGVPTALALVAYGFVLLALARYARTRA